MKIIFRKAKKGDGKGFVEFWNEGVRRKFFLYTGSNSLRLRKDIYKANKKYGSKKLCNFTYLAIDSDNGKIIGCSNAHGSEKGRTRHRLEIGWMVHPDYAGKGIATKLVGLVIKEAKKTGFKRIEAEAAVCNIPSIKLAKRLRFKIEGKRKTGLILDDGSYVDTYLFGMTLK